MKFEKITISALLLCILFSSCQSDDLDNINSTGKQSFDLKESSIDQDSTRILYDDFPYGGENGKLQKFVLSGAKWSENNLTYYFKNGTSDITNAQKKAAFQEAFQLWSDVTPLNFEEVHTSNADIVIAFEVGDHGDGYPFDNGGSLNSSNVLAHAFFPPPAGGALAGNVHFDDYENWTTNLRPYGGQPIDLITVAAHEIGHSLGLRHSEDPDALMYDYYKGSHRYLNEDDVQGIQEIYGFGTPDLFIHQRWATNQGGFWNEQKWMSGDFNGDGISDLANAMYNGNGGTNIDVHVSDGNGSLDHQRWATNQGGFWNEQKWMSGDFNGDGISDLANAMYNGNGGTNIDVHISNGNGSFSQQRWATNQGSFSNGQRWIVGDFNGNGVSDLAAIMDSGNGETNIDIHISNGNGSFSHQRWATNQGGFWNVQNWVAGDFNGDGISDIAGIMNDGKGGTNIDIHISSGSGAFDHQRWATNQGGFWNEQKYLSGDFNSNGKFDLATIMDNGSGGTNIDVRIYKD